MTTEHQPTLLSDLQIVRRLVADDPSGIFVSPLVTPRFQLGPASLDVHIGTDLRTTRITATTHIDLTQSKEKVQAQISEYVERKGGEPGESLVLHPGEFALANTLEFIRLPRDIAGRLEGRSSLGRLGLQIHATAGFIDPGFEGTLTFELINAGSLPLKIRPGIRIAQLCFFPIADVQVPYMSKPGSKYGGKLLAEVSQIYKDPEIGG